MKLLDSSILHALFNSGVRNKERQEPIHLDSIADS
jgi:hypothetical protein